MGAVGEFQSSLGTFLRVSLRQQIATEILRMSTNAGTNNEWDVFAENHFLGHVPAANEEEAIAAGIKLFGSHLEGILRAQPRVQTKKDGWSRPI